MQTPNLLVLARPYICSSALRVPLALLVVALLAVAPSRVDAQQATAIAAAPEPDPPSVFESGYQGLLSGAVVGLAGGYLAARRGDFERSDWRAIGLGIGIGALSGAALGISLGLADRAGAPAGRYIARDLSLGSGFGAVVGAIAGGISAIAKKEAEHVLFGASIGVIAGAGVGIITGIIEGQAKRRRSASAARARVELSPSLAVASAGSGLHAQTLVPGLLGRF